MVQRWCFASAPLPRVNCEVFGGEAGGERVLRLCRTRLSQLILSRKSTVKCSGKKQLEKRVQRGREAGAVVVWQAIVGAISQYINPLLPLKTSRRWAEAEAQPLPPQ